MKVVPGSSREGVVGRLGEAWKVRVAAPAERGRANDAVEHVLAEAVGIPPEDVRIVAGATSARKIVEIAGLSDAEVERRLTRRISSMAGVEPRRAR